MYSSIMPISALDIRVLWNQALMKFLKHDLSRIIALKVLFYKIEGKAKSGKLPSLQ